MSALNVPCGPLVEVTAEFPARHLCPFQDEVDDGNVQITWLTSHGQTVELHALAELVMARANEKVSHEQWTADLAAAIHAHVDVTVVGVVSRWVTAGGTVTVRTPQLVSGAPAGAEGGTAA